MPRDECQTLIVQLGKLGAIIRLSGEKAISGLLSEWTASVQRFENSSILASQILIVLSFEHVASHRLSAENFMEVIPLVWPANVLNIQLLFMSHI